MEAKAQDFRIGNYVNVLICTNEQQQIVDVMYDCINTYDAECVGYEFIKPIPLTEQWLLDLGFTHEYDDWELGSFHLDSNFCFNTISKDVKVDFVHQLQNWYYLYEGEELTLKSQ